MSETKTSIIDEMVESINSITASKSTGGKHYASPKELVLAMAKHRVTKFGVKGGLLAKEFPGKTFTSDEESDFRGECRKLADDSCALISDALVNGRKIEYPVFLVIRSTEHNDSFEPKVAKDKATLDSFLKIHFDSLAKRRANRGK